MTTDFLSIARWAACGLAGLVLGTACAFAQDSSGDLGAQFLRQVYVDRYASLPPLPEMALMAFVAAQDRNFMERAPEYSTVTRALAGTLAAPGTGASERLALAARLGSALTREEILNAYVQTVFLGHGCHGARAAALAYLGREIESVDARGLALLAALVDGSAVLDPQTQHDALLERRNFVLREMVSIGALTLGQAQAAQAAHLDLADPVVPCAGP